LQTALHPTDTAESAYAFEISVVGDQLSKIFYVIGVLPIIAFFKRKVRAQIPECAG
jgi:hypothetical protein